MTDPITPPPPMDPHIRWLRSYACWVADVGPPFANTKGRVRRRAVTFPGIDEFDRSGAEIAVAAYLAVPESERPTPPLTGLTPTQLVTLRTQCSRWYPNWGERLERFYSITRVHVSEADARALADSWNLSGWTGYASRYAPRVALPLCDLCGLARRGLTDGAAWQVDGRICGGCEEELREERRGRMRLVGSRYGKAFNHTETR